MNPDGTLDTWEMTTGDMYFIPRAYPHHIENVGTDDWHFLIFFDQPFPADIGYRASASAYSREVLAATFNTHIDDLPNLPFTPGGPADRQPRQPRRLTTNQRFGICPAVSAAETPQLTEREGARP
jgi:oxalate decarboxylase